MKIKRILTIIITVSLMASLVTPVSAIQDISDKNQGDVLFEESDIIEETNVLEKSDIFEDTDINEEADDFEEAGIEIDSAECENADLDDNEIHTREGNELNADSLKTGEIEYSATEADDVIIPNAEDLDDNEETDDTILTEAEYSVSGFMPVEEDFDIDSMDEPISGKKPLMLKASSIPSKYETPDMPKLRNQGPYGTCWAITSVTLAEINRLKDIKVAKSELSEQDKQIDYSELQLAYFSYNTVTDPLGGTAGDVNRCISNNRTGSNLKEVANAGGNPIFSSAVLANWVGASNESVVPYNLCGSSGNVNPSYAYLSDIAHLTNYYMINIKKNPQNAKKLIMDYGSLTASMYSCNESQAISQKFYNEEHNCYYMNTTVPANHSVTIVGWDDDFSRDNFNIRPDSDGAWLIRNSWYNEQSGMNDEECYSGYFWLSYEDRNLSDVSFAFDFEAADNYEFNYQYDGAMKTAVDKYDNTVTASNVFYNDSDEYKSIEAVSYYTSSANVNYSIDMYYSLKDANNPESGKLAKNSTSTGTTTYPGYHTIRLKNPVIIKPHDSFSAVITLEKDGDISIGHEVSDSGSWYRVTASAMPGQSFVKENGIWTDYGALHQCNIRIKAFGSKKVVDDRIILPTNRTYLIGDELNVTGGKIVDNNTEAECEVTEDMVTGFDSSIEGIKTITVDYGYGSFNYDILVVSPPKISALAGDSCEDIDVGSSDYGTFVINHTGELRRTAGVQKVAFDFTPIDTDRFNAIHHDIDVTFEKSCIVSFDIMGHGALVPDKRVKFGTTIAPVYVEDVEDYTFGGWYCDHSETAFAFESTPVKEDIILKANWLKKCGTGFSINSVGDQLYTGSKIKPVVIVKDDTTGTILKNGTDYTIAYYNNVNCNSDKAVPYITIKGRGNYANNVERIDFNIVPKSLGDGDSVANGIKLSYSGTLSYNAKSAQNPLSSVTYARKLKAGRDYTVTITDSLGAQCIGAKIPAGGMGTFTMKIEGCGNYTGSIVKPIGIIDAAHNIAKTSVSVGSKYKNIKYDEYVKLAGSSDSVIKEAIEANKMLTVKMGKTILEYGRDYNISFPKATVGKVSIDITGIGEYSGIKTFNVSITGKKFADSNILVGDNDKLGSYVYTGSYIWIDPLRLYNQEIGEYLISGRDYTVTYKNNINKGTATVTFEGIKESGYSGKFNKTYKIIAAGFEYIGGDISVPYSREKAKPASKVDGNLVNTGSGCELVNGRDYTLSYSNNAYVASKDATKAPTIVIKGKGNYSGQLRIPFEITKQYLDASKINISVAECQYNPKAKVTYQYKPTVTVKDGNSKLSNNKDYRVEYVGNTQTDVVNYLEGMAFSPNPYPSPIVRIYPIEGSAYIMSDGIEYIECTMPIYARKLSGSNTKVILSMSQYEYSGTQIRPTVSVSYKSGGAYFPLTAVDEEHGIVGDYMVSYGANTKVGSKSGIVTIKGNAPYYGGSVTVRFMIVGKRILLF